MKVIIKDKDSVYYNEWGTVILKDEDNYYHVAIANGKNCIPIFDKTQLKFVRKSLDKQIQA